MYTNKDCKGYFSILKDIPNCNILNGNSFNNIDVVSNNEM